MIGVRLMSFEAVLWWIAGGWGGRSSSRGTRPRRHVTCRQAGRLRFRFASFGVRIGVRLSQGGVWLVVKVDNAGTALSPGRGGDANLARHFGCRRFTFLGLV